MAKKFSTNQAINLKIDLAKKISDMMAKEEINISAMDIKVSSYAEKPNSKNKKKSLKVSVDGQIMIKFNSIINKNQRFDISEDDDEDENEANNFLDDDLLDDEEDGNKEEE